MTIYKCDGCHEVLDENEARYTVDGISYTAPNSSAKSIRVYIHDKEEDSEGHNVLENWHEYKDLHFCHDCWEAGEIKKYVTHGGKK